MEPVARQHLAGCADCRVLLDDARAEEGRIFSLLRALDHPPPVADPMRFSRRGALRAPGGRVGRLASCWWRRPAGPHTPPRLAASRDPGPTHRVGGSHRDAIRPDRAIASRGALGGRHRGRAGED